MSYDLGYIGSFKALLINITQHPKIGAIMLMVSCDFTVLDVFYSFLVEQK